VELFSIHRHDHNDDRATGRSGSRPALPYRVPSSDLQKAQQSTTDGCHTFMQLAVTETEIGTQLTRAVIAVLFVMLASYPVAHADGQDDQYLRLLASQGIQGAPDQLIAAGHESCDALDQGRFGIGISPYGAAMLKIEAELTGQGLSSPQISQLVHDANNVYCPGKA
jgi:Protein of unknown function (DUF732)